MDGDLGGWGARLLDVNGTYAEVQLINHSIWSIAIPILLVDLVFPDLRGKALLGRAGLSVWGLVYVFGVALTALGARTSAALSLGYVTPLPLVVVTLLTVATLAAIAIKVLPQLRHQMPGPGSNPAPHPWLVGVLAGVVSVLILGITFFPRHRHLAFLQTPLVLLPLVATVVILEAALVLLARRAGGLDWDDRHRFALACGALAGHTAAGFAITPRAVDLAIWSAIATALLMLLGRPVWRRDRRLILA